MPELHPRINAKNPKSFIISKFNLVQFSSQQKMVHFDDLTTMLYLFRPASVSRKLGLPTPGNMRRYLSHPTRRQKLEARIQKAYPSDFAIDIKNISAPQWSQEEIQAKLKAHLGVQDHPEVPIQTTANKLALEGLLKFRLPITALVSSLFLLARTLPDGMDLIDQRDTGLVFGATLLVQSLFEMADNYPNIGAGWYDARFNKFAYQANREDQEIRLFLHECTHFWQWQKMKIPKSAPFINRKFSVHPFFEGHAKLVEHTLAEELFKGNNLYKHKLRMDEARLLLAAYMYCCEQEGFEPSEDILRIKSATPAQLSKELAKTYGLGYATFAMWDSEDSDNVAQKALDRDFPRELMAA